LVSRICISFADESEEAQHKAYAYLLLPRDMMTVGAARRAINAHQAIFGTGGRFLKIAMRDLEIRGAGNLPGNGAERAHYQYRVRTVTASYCSKAVAKLKGKRVSVSTDVAIRLEFYLHKRSRTFKLRGPVTAGVHPRGLYGAAAIANSSIQKNLPSYQSRDALRELGVEWRDRFGPPRGQCTIFFC